VVPTIPEIETMRERGKREKERERERRREILTSTTIFSFVFKTIGKVIFIK
jgi:hypothetical protein